MGPPPARESNLRHYSTQPLLHPLPPKPPQPQGDRGQLSLNEMTIRPSTTPSKPIEEKPATKPTTEDDGDNDDGDRMDVDSEGSAEMSISSESHAASDHLLEQKEQQEEAGIGLDDNGKEGKAEAAPSAPTQGSSESSGAGEGDRDQPSREVGEEEYQKLLNGPTGGFFKQEYIQILRSRRD